jgi:DNA helicase II / ATP-dependent DNA helicase PcrA
MSIPGPAALGRGVVVSAGQEAPPDWSGAPRHVIDEAALADPGPTVAMLHRAWAERVAVVVELAVDPARFREPVSVPVAPWTLDAGFELWLERLHFLVWANTYDARTDAEQPVWWWARKAARLPGVVELPPGTTGDVRLPDGSAAWIDGGPRAPFVPPQLDGLALVHRESIELGRSTPAPSTAAAAAPTAELAPDQLAAVAHRSGPARIIAPAGSGKTRVLTERLRHLIVDRKFEGQTVLAVAYNKKAQQELETRCADFGPRVRTLNSLGYALLAEARGTAPRVLDEREVRRLMEEIVPVRRHRTNTDPIGPYLEALGQVRLGLRDPDEVESWRDDVPGLAEAFVPYRAALADAGAVDFDEQVYGAVEVLLADGGFRRQAQAGCRHLLVDEFQDLTPAHVLLLRLLAAPALEVFGVGDDDQVIYGHAGADPTFLIGFEILFPAAGDHPLAVNYRCPAAVVSAAATLLSYNDRRVAKTIRPGPDPSPDEDALEVVNHAAGGGAAAVVDAVSGWLTGATPTGAADIAVLARVNALLLAPQVALATAGIPVASVLRADVLERTGLRAALAYLRIATAPAKRMAAADIVEVLRRPSRGLPQWFPDRIRRRSSWTVADLLGVAAALRDEKVAAKVELLVEDLRQVVAAGAAEAATTAGVLAIVKDSIGLGGAMTLLDSSRGGEGSSHLDDLEGLAQVAALHPDPFGFEDWLRAALARETSPGGVTLSTVHRVKGMEWDRVIVFGASAGILPHRLAEDIEEERRVFHVALTRGRRQVIVLADRSRPSPFLAELDGRAPHGRLKPHRAEVSPVPPARAPAGPAADPAVEQVLRAWRTERSRRDKVPPYIVLHDRTLLAIAATRPTSLMELRRIDGIGPTKLDQYGDEIVALLAAAPTGAGSTAAPGRA